MKYNLQIELLDECNIEKIYISEVYNGQNFKRRIDV